MTKIVVTDRAGAETEVEAIVGFSIMEIMHGAGFTELLALCGGCCSCATCHVYVDPRFASALPPVSQDEDALLDISSQRTRYSRLACQIRFNEALDGIAVRIAPED